MDTNTDVSKNDVGTSKELSDYTVSANMENEKEKIILSKYQIEVTKECDSCEKKIKQSRPPLLCHCIERYFCSDSCQQNSIHFGECKGRMKPVKIAIDDFLPSHMINTGKDEDEEERGVREKICDLFQRAGDPSQIKRMAKEGDPVAAWNIGCGFSNRIATSFKNRLVNPACMPKSYLKKSVGETDEIAIKYFEIAAKGGLREGQLSLANKIFHASSLKIDQRIACYWMAKAHKNGCKDAMPILEDQMMLVRDVHATLSQLENLPSHMILSVKQSGQNAVMCGPNLGSFLTATRIAEISEWNGRTCKGSDYPMYGFSKFKKLKTMKGKLPLEVVNFLVVIYMSMYIKYL